MEYSDTVLSDIALVTKSATVGKSPVEIVDTTLAEGALAEPPSPGRCSSGPARTAVNGATTRLRRTPSPNPTAPHHPLSWRCAPSTAFAPVVNVTADVTGRLIAVRRRPGVQPSPKLVLFHNGEVIGRCTPS